MEAGFYKADSANLPKVDVMMVANYFSTNPDFCASEFRNIKMSMSARQSYGDDAVGYVQLKREHNLCTIKGKLCPEHKVHSKSYSVSIIIDEKIEIVTHAQCHDCTASEGGCKHSVAFLMWLHRRSEEPSCTSVQCYWKKSTLSKVGSTIKYITAKELANVVQNETSPDSNVYDEFVREGLKRNLHTCQILRHQPEYCMEKVRELALHQLMLQHSLFKDCKMFISKIKNIFTESIIQDAELMTRDQNKSSVWYELRYGRVTASKAYEVSKCNTDDGTLVAAILGARFPETIAIKRGKTLEDTVRKSVENMLGKKIVKCGLYISSQFPIIAGSPDGICDKNATVEIKCPSTAKTMLTYIKNGKVTKKYYAQIQMQLFVTSLRSCYFCVADHEFEINKKVNIIKVNYDNDYCIQLIDCVTAFWEKYIYPILYESTRV